MKAAVLTEYRKFEWLEVPEPETGDHDVLVQVGFASICGSDMHIFNGDFHPRTRIPFIPGHEFAGKITACGSKIKKFQPGERVAIDPIIWCGHCAACRLGHYPACTSLKLIGVDLNGGFGEYVLTKEEMLYPLPDTISDKNAALIEVYAIGFHAINRGGLKKDDTVLIWGTGRIGNSVLQAARTRTRNLIVCVDLVESRLQMAKQAYPDIEVVNLEVEDPIDRIRELTDGRGLDVAFEVVGHAVDVPDRPNPVRGCIQGIRGAGTVCVLGLGDELTPILMKELIWKEARIVASRVSHGEFKKAIDHLAAGDLNPDSLITREMPARDIQRAFELLENEPAKYLKILLRMS